MGFEYCEARLAELRAQGEEARRRGLEYYITGGRSPNLVVWDPRKEEIVHLTARGGFEDLGDGLILFYNHGCAWLVEGEIVEKVADSVHGCWKVVCHQLAVRVRRRPAQVPYIAFTYSAGSYATTSVLVVKMKDGGTDVYMDLSGRSNHRGVVINGCALVCSGSGRHRVYVDEGTVMEQNPDTGEVEHVTVEIGGRGWLDDDDLKAVLAVLRLGLPCLFIWNERTGEVWAPRIKTNMEEVRNS